MTRPAPVCRRPKRSIIIDEGCSLPKLLRRHPRAFGERSKLHPYDLGVDLDPAGEGAEAAIDTGDYILAAGSPGILHDAVGDQLRMLDEVRGGIDHAGDDGL